MSIPEVTRRKFPLPITKDSFTYKPGVVALTELLRSINFLQNVLPASVPLMSILGEKQIRKEYVSEGEAILEKNIVEMFNLDASINPTRFILNQLKTANEVTEYIRQKLNIPKGRLNDEIDIEDPLLLRTISRHLRKNKVSHNRGEKKVSPKVSYELRRQLLLAIISGHLHMNTASNRSHELLSALQYELNESFYGDEIIGETTDKTFITTHDLQTNEVTSYREISDVSVLQPNEKSVLFHFRHAMLDDGKEIEVYSKDRKKGDVEAIIKSIARVDKTNGEIDPTNEVEDSIGKRFVVNGGDEVRDTFMEKYVQTIRIQYPNARIEPDPPLKKSPGEADRGQSSMTDYNRVKIYFEGKTTPYEVICYSLKNFLNSKVHIGKADEHGQYDGYGHLMFELRRIAKVAKVLFPEELYEYDIEELVMLAMKEEAIKLLSAGKIEYE